MATAAVSASRPASVPHKLEARPLLNSGGKPRKVTRYGVDGRPMRHTKLLGPKTDIIKKGVMHGGLPFFRDLDKVPNRLIPEDHQPPHRDTASLRHARKADWIPDISYDIDGDGVVSQEDYFWARHFDTDGGGTLDDEEKAAAKVMKEEGFMHKFLDMTLGDTKTRVQQRADGSLIGAADELTLSEKAAAKGSPNQQSLGVGSCLRAAPIRSTHTRSGLLDGRKVDRTTKQREEYARWDTAHPEYSAVPNGKHFKAGHRKLEGNDIQAEYFPKRGSDQAPTRSELMAFRKTEFIPDPSFDIDGDGAVSAKDYFYASKFDIDQSGKLEESERRKAKQMMLQGFANSFINLDTGTGSQTGGARLRKNDAGETIELGGNIEYLMNNPSKTGAAHASMGARIALQPLIGHNGKEAVIRPQPADLDKTSRAGLTLTELKARRRATDNAANEAGCHKFVGGMGYAYTPSQTEPHLKFCREPISRHKTMPLDADPTGLC